MQVFRGLVDAPRELRLVYVLKLLESFADFSTSLNFVLYLTNDFGLSDFEAGTFYGVWGVVTSIYGMIFGPLIDRLGVRRSLLIGGSLLTFGRVLMAWARTRTHVMVAAFFVQPCGMALAIPVLSIAIRRTTDDSSRSAAYGLFYAVMNVGALLSGLGTDALNSYLRDRYSQSVALRVLFWTGAATSLAYTLVVWRVFRELPPVIALDERVDEGRPTAEGRRSTWQVVRETWADGVFWRLVAFTGILFGARSIFRHMDTTIPVWMQRTIGPGARYGDVYSINPLIVILTVAPVQAYLARDDPYRIVVLGTALTSLAPFVLWLAPPSYMSVVLFMVVLSGGEVFYAAKTMEFSMLLAPEGREGVYGTLAAAPLFVVRLVSGVTSGGLLAAYCPADPPRHCQTMWFIIGLISVSTPVLLFVLRPWLYTDAVRARIADSRSRAERRVLATEILLDDLERASPLSCDDDVDDDPPPNVEASTPAATVPTLRHISPPPLVGPTLDYVLSMRREHTD